MRNSEKKNIDFFLFIVRGMKCCKIKSLLGVRRRFQLPYCITIFWEQTSSDQTTLSPSCCEILRNAGAAAEGSAAAGSGVVGVALPVPGQHTPIEHGWTITIEIFSLSKMQKFNIIPRGTNHSILQSTQIGWKIIGRLYIQIFGPTISKSWTKVRIDLDTSLHLMFKYTDQIWYAYIFI